MIPVKFSFGRFTGAVRRFPGGTENAIILATLSREMLKCRAASRWPRSRLIPPLTWPTFAPPFLLVRS